jgi:two-component system, sensor histidine kinase and response regulator
METCVLQLPLTWFRVAVALGHTTEAKTPGMNRQGASSHEGLTGRKILVVDDDRLNIRILSSILKREGFQVEEADSGEQALVAYAQFLPDLVLLDVVMPGIDGFETCRQLNSKYGEECAPVIFITARNASDDIVQGLEAGCVDYLPKPFKDKEVLARIRSHLQNRILREQLLRLVERLNKADASKNRLLGMAAHDLRNPLASVRGFAGFLREGVGGPLVPVQLDLVNMIHDASQSMLEVVNELLDVATIESGELKLRLERHSLADLVAKAVRFTNIQAARKKTHVEFVDPEASPVLMIDVAKMRQVIDNLLSNAIKYSPPGATIRALIQGGPEQSSCGFSVQDQGPGIADGERDKLFKDFSTLSSRPTAGEKSTGLGLAICRKIVEAHHGSIHVENLPAGGCEFSVSLPCAA